MNEREILNLPSSTSTTGHRSVLDKQNNEVDGNNELKYNEIKIAGPVPMGLRKPLQD